MWKCENGGTPEMGAVNVEIGKCENVEMEGLLRWEN